MSKIFFFYADKVENIKNKKLIKNLISLLFDEERISLKRINYVFCSDAYLLIVNQKYLNHDTFTDIITFPLSEKEQPIAAEIYISLERTKENAKAYNVPYQIELVRVIIHGALHLCGYSDKAKSTQKEMRLKEDYYLNRFNVLRETNT